jgi:hypothetical protein
VQCLKPGYLVSLPLICVFPLHLDWFLSSVFWSYRSLQIVECACMVELKMLGGYKKLQEKHPTVKVIIIIPTAMCLGLLYCLLLPFPP